MAEILMALSLIGLVVLILGVGGLIFELICRLPIVEEFLDFAFKNSPLGRDDIQELNRQQKGTK